jgi:hypothetical protein
MKKILFIMILAASASLLSAQENTDNKDNDKEMKTIFGGGETTHGGFGAIEVNYTELMDKNSLLVGVRGGWVINHWLNMGLGGKGLVTGIHKDVISGNNVLENSMDFYMGYGGLYFEPTLAPKFPVHLSFPVLIGAGGAVYVDNVDTWDDEDNDYNSVEVDNDAFFVVEPGVMLEMNVIKNMRFGFTVSHRFIDDLKLIETDSDALDGMSYCFTIKIGKF